MNRHRLVEIAIRHQVQQRPERFVFHDLKIRLCGCQARLHVTVAGDGESLAAVEHLASFIFQPLNGFLDHIDSVFVNERSHHGFAIERTANWQALVTGKEFIADLRRN